MSKFICHNCGTGNSPESLFCGKCATSLKRDQLKRQRHLHVLTPPQDLVDRPSFAPSTPTPTFASAGTLMIGMIVVVTIIIGWIYLMAFR
ncbi:MAG: zinc-ribbon domain-containing protein [Patescibacteria group bacterium]